MGREDEIRITKSELADMIASAVSAAVQAVNAARPAAVPSIPFDANEQLAKQAAMLRPEGIPPEAVRRVSARTGLTFTALIHRDVVVNILEEVEPPGCLTHKKEGGLVPDALPIKYKDGSVTPQYKQWKWQHIRHPVFDELIGKDRAWLMRQTNPVDEPKAAE